MGEGVFFEFAAILGIAVAVSALGMALRQPLIVSFLATGILTGPVGLSIVESTDQLELLASIGISILLFVVGLRLDLRLIRTTGPVALATGLGQVVFTSAIGFVIALAMGFTTVGSLYIATTLTFSSTIIIVKLLSDKQEIDSLHGRIAVGFLIVQDIIAIIALIVLAALGRAGGGEDDAALAIAQILLKGAALVIVVGLLMRFVLPGLTARLAANQELLALFAIAWAVVLGAVGEYVGFGKEVGAFLGGVSLASTEFREAIGARLVGVRDFLLLFFFIDFGSRLEFSLEGADLLNAVWLSAFVLVGNPVVVMVIMGVMGYRRRTGFLAGLTVAQISEFSLIVAALGLGLGHIDTTAAGVITLVGVITICVSTYMILYSGPLYRRLDRPLRIFERGNPYREPLGSEDLMARVDVVLVGLGRFGGGLLRGLRERDVAVLGVDFDPQAVEAWRGRGIPVVFGDTGDPELLNSLSLSHARWVVSSVRERTVNLTLLRLLKAHAYTGRIALTAVDREEVELYQRAGADLVLRPFSDASEVAAEQLHDALNPMPEIPGWPVTLAEFVVQDTSIFVGRALREVEPVTMEGIRVVALSRGGRIHFGPDEDVVVYPRDRLILAGDAADLARAEDLWQEITRTESRFDLSRLQTAEAPIRDTSDRPPTVADLVARVPVRVAVVGIDRDGRRTVLPDNDERLLPGDRVLLLGTADAVAAATATLTG